MDGWKITTSTLIQKFETTFTQMMCRKCKQDGMKLPCSLKGTMGWCPCHEKKERKQQYILQDYIPTN